MNTASLWVGNLASDSTETELRTAFERFGTIEKVAVLRDGGFVHFQTASEASSALSARNGNYRMPRAEKYTEVKGTFL